MGTSSTVTPIPPAAHADFEEEPRGGVLRTVLQFVAIPLLIVTVSIGIFIGFRMLLGDPSTTALDYVAELRSDTVNRRHQAAFELANRLSGGAVPADFRDPRFVAAVAAALDEERAADEPEPQMALALIRILTAVGGDGAVDALRSAARDEQDWIRSHALAGLGTLGDTGAAGLLREAADDADPGTRQAALVGLARLEETDDGLVLSDGTRDLALLHLQDAHEDVRLSAARILSLAGRTEGLPLVKKALDRKWLEQFRFDDRLPGTSRYTVHSNLILEMLRVVPHVPGAADDDELLGLIRMRADTEHEGDPAVREAARKVLEKLEKE